MDVPRQNDAVALRDQFAEFQLLFRHHRLLAIVEQRPGRPSARIRNERKMVDDKQMTDFRMSGQCLLDKLQIRQLEVNKQKQIRPVFDGVVAVLDFRAFGQNRLQIRHDGFREGLAAARRTMVVVSFDDIDRRFAESRLQPVDDFREHLLGRLHRLAVALRDIADLEGERRLVVHFARRRLDESRSQSLLRVPVAHVAGELRLALLFLLFIMAVHVVVMQITEHDDVVRFIRSLSLLHFLWLFRLLRRQRERPCNHPCQ